MFGSQTYTVCEISPSTYALTQHALDRMDARRLSADTVLTVLTYGRAAWTRDQGRCVFPKCRRPPADLHHLTWWSHGGHTDLDNAAWLCAFHHWLVHEANWTLRRDKRHRYVFTAPDGRHITHPPRQPQAA